MNTLQEWLNKPIPNDHQAMAEWLDELMEYVNLQGQFKVIFELAESDVLAGLKPMSANPIYMAAYTIAQRLHSVEVVKETNYQRIKQLADSLDFSMDREGAVEYVIDGMRRIGLITSTSISEMTESELALLEAEMKEFHRCLHGD